MATRGTGYVGKVERGKIDKKQKKLLTEDGGYNSKVNHLRRLKQK